MLHMFTYYIADWCFLIIWLIINLLSKQDLPLKNCFSYKFLFTEKPAFQDEVLIKINDDFSVERSLGKTGTAVYNCFY